MNCDFLFWVIVTFSNQTLRIMKTWLMTFGFLMMAATMTAQDSKLSAKSDIRGGVTRSTIRQGDLYGELVAFKQANMTMIRFNIDDIVIRMTANQEFLDNLEAMREYRFKSTTEALNILSSHGWELRSSSVVRGRQGEEEHFILSYTVDNLRPVSPWLSGGSARGKSGKN